MENAFPFHFWVYRPTEKQPINDDEEPNVNRPSSPCYFRHFIQQNMVDFPAQEEAKIYAGKIEYTVDDWRKIDRLTSNLYNDVLPYEEILSGKQGHHHRLDMTLSCQHCQHVMPTDVDMWWKDLKVYLKERKNVTDWEESMNDGTFPKYLSDFLYHEDGAQAKRKFLFAGGAKVECDEPAPEIAASRFFPFRRRCRRPEIRDVAFPGAVRTEVDPSWGAAIRTPRKRLQSE